jgi:hypothetical protein
LRRITLVTSASAALIWGAAASRDSATSEIS